MWLTRRFTRSATLQSISMAVRNPLNGEVNLLMAIKKYVTFPSVLVFCFPVAAHANAGVPLIFLPFPIMLIALLPIIFIESSIFKRIVPVSYKKLCTECRGAHLSV